MKAAYDISHTLTEPTRPKYEFHSPVACMARAYIQLPIHYRSKPWSHEMQHMHILWKTRCHQQRKRSDGSRWKSVYTLPAFPPCRFRIVVVEFIIYIVLLIICVEKQYAGVSRSGQSPKKCKYTSHAIAHHEICIYACMHNFMYIMYTYTCTHKIYSKYAPIYR